MNFSKKLPMLPRVAHQILQAAKANENGKDLMAKQVTSGELFQKTQKNITTPPRPPMNPPFFCCYLDSTMQKYEE